MAAAKYPIVIEQGATFSRGMQLSAGGPVSEGGTPIDITGCELRMQVRKNVRSQDPYLSLTSTGAVAGQTGIYVTNASSGQFVITIHADDTTGIDWTAGVYDLEMETVSGVVRRYLYGSVKVTKEVTR